jgi:prevent-host-death family protein
MKGAIAEAVIYAEAVKLGLVVLRPQVEGRRYDLIIDTGPRLLRVQCKWAPRQGKVVVVRTQTSRHTPHGYVTSTYTADEIDGIAAYCQELERCYYVPIEVAAGHRSLHLRLAPAGNRQEAAVHWAADYPLGAIAQLGERLLGMQEVGGSSPPSSIASSETVRAHDFRERFGWYMERVNGGQRLMVTRHGKPFVRLEPVEAAPPALPGLAEVTPLRPGRDVA